MKYGIILGILYFKIMNRGLEKTNCSYISNIWTDILAFIAGFIIINKGITYGDNTLQVLGTAIITEHILQFCPKIID